MATSELGRSPGIATLDQLTGIFDIIQTNLAHLALPSACREVDNRYGVPVYNVAPTRGIVFAGDALAKVGFLKPDNIPTVFSVGVEYDPPHYRLCGLSPEQQVELFGVGAREGITYFEPENVAVVLTHEDGVSQSTVEITKRTPDGQYGGMSIGVRVYDELTFSLDALLRLPPRRHDSLSANAAERLIQALGILLPLEQSN